MEANIDSRWIRAIEDELSIIHRNSTWELVPFPSRKTLISTNWIFKSKVRSDGTFNKFKVQLVAWDFEQHPRIDLDKIFASVENWSTICIVVALAAQQGWKMTHMDIKMAFLHSDLKEEVYVSQLEGFCEPERDHLVCQFLKAL